MTLAEITLTLSEYTKIADGYPRELRGFDEPFFTIHRFYRGQHPRDVSSDALVVGVVLSGDDPEVHAMRRIRTFSQGEHPAREGLIQSAIQNYGEPSSQLVLQPRGVSRNVVHRFYWALDASGALIPGWVPNTYSGGWTCPTEEGVLNFLRLGESLSSDGELDPEGGHAFALSDRCGSVTMTLVITSDIETNNVSRFEVFIRSRDAYRRAGEAWAALIDESKRRVAVPGAPVVCCD